jgi:hypothetical protein
MACRVAGLHCTLYIPKSIRERMRLEEMSNIIRELRRAIRVGILTINQENLRLVFNNCVSDLRHMFANEADHLQADVY